MQILTFGPMILGFGGNAFDMAGVWRQPGQKSIGGPLDSSFLDLVPEFRLQSEKSFLMADFGP